MDSEDAVEEDDRDSGDYSFSEEENSDSCDDEGKKKVKRLKLFGWLVSIYIEMLDCFCEY